MRDLGEMGESIFSLWCASVGLTANKSIIDRHGWDYIVEFPLPIHSNTNSLHESAIVCKVQIKATDKKEKKLPIKLSNLRRLATDLVPTFIIFIEFNCMDIAEEAYIVHIDNQRCTEILKKIHLVTQKYPNKKLNEQTMTIKYDKSHKILYPDGEHLKNSLVNHIGKSYSKYIADKKSHLEKTGFENGHGNISILIKGKEEIHNLIDSLMGLPKKTNVAKFVGYNSRFGILEKNPFIEQNEGQIEFTNIEHTIEGIISFKKEKFIPGLEFSSKLYIPPFIVAMPSELQKFRVTTNFYEFIFTPHNNAFDFSYNINNYELIEINELDKMIKLDRLLRCSGESFLVELAFEGHKLEFFATGHTSEFEDQELLDSINKIKSLMAHYNICDQIYTSIALLSTFKDNTKTLYDIIIQKRKDGVFKIDEPSLALPEEKSIAIIFLMKSIIGNYIIGAIITYLCDKFDQQNGTYYLPANEVIVDKLLASKDDHSITKDDIHKEITIIAKKYDEKYLTLIPQVKPC